MRLGRSNDARFMRVRIQSVEIVSRQKPAFTIAATQRTVACTNFGAWSTRRGICAMRGRHRNGADKIFA